MSIKTESISEFYTRTSQVIPPELVGQTAGSHFNVKRRTFVNRISPYNRRDFYKICLVVGKGLLVSKNTEVQIEKAAVIFANPAVPLSYQALSPEQSGYYCLFNEAFVLSGLRQEIKYESPLFNQSLNLVSLLNEQQVVNFSHYFQEMEKLMESDYSYRYDMVKSILQTLIHEGIRLQEPSVGKSSNIADRTIARFFDLIDQQFPIDSPENPLTLKTPSHFAEMLHVHVNHLNNLVKKSTGKTTQQIIQERIIAEAKILLINTDWDAAEIAYSLGFDYPSHFSKYFKQATLTTPLLFRENLSLKIGSI